MAIEVMPEWLASLDEEDVSFIKKFVLASGSLKEVAGIYGVTYPTVRLRLEYPTDSLSELALRFDPPISKPGLSHRLKKIIELAEKED